MVDRRPIHVHDLARVEDDFPEGQPMAIRLGHRTILSTPLMREGEAIGALSIRRTEVRPFSGKHIALIKTFADQAVIAIENARLFEEVQARTRELKSRSSTRPRPGGLRPSAAQCLTFNPCLTPLLPRRRDLPGRKGIAFSAC